MKLTCELTGTTEGTDNAEESLSILALIGALAALDKDGVTTDKKVSKSIMGQASRTYHGTRPQGPTQTNSTAVDRPDLLRMLWKSPLRLIVHTAGGELTATFPGRSALVG